ncbi:MAG: AraC family transcriptional regulator [Hyphomicrobiaceae bacterium]|nr:AraC family transcriptional regulator [Hyphomicrobiaceae bacterium]
MELVSQRAEQGFMPLGSADHVWFFRAERFDALECLHARFHTHRFQPHTHETYAIASIIHGVEYFTCAGVQYAAGPGQLALVNPETVHDGEPRGAEGFAYRTAYPTVACMRDIAEDLTGRRVGTPTFADAVVDDADCAGIWAEAHRLAERGADPLAIDTAMTAAFAHMLARHADLPPPRRIGDETGPIARVRAHLDGNYHRAVDLDELAGVARLSRTNLIRAFAKTTGLTPHAYLTDRRVRAARAHLSAGMAPAEAAALCGFYDQAHLNRAFKARIGVTPGAYRGL